jgi:pimeloyl-ACP methyl ester carboxylesterase
MSFPPDVRERVLDVWGGRIALRVKTIGHGAPIVYLHPASGLQFDPFLAALSDEYSIYAPEIPGSSAGDPNAIHEVDSLSDLVLIYEEAIRRLELPEPPAIIGQSFGGMLAAELASYFPALFRRVVLCAPIGLWRADLPIANWMTTPASKLPALLFKNSHCEAARAMATLPPDPAPAATILSNFVWTLGCTGKFVWPIPDKGLRQRLHRMTTPTLIVWGADDALIPAAYAKEFSTAIAGSRVEIVRDSGHIPQEEQMETTLAIVRGFLGDVSPAIDRPRTSS